jgi:hypothetical protein
MEEADALVQRILRCDQAAIESAKEKVDRGRAGATASPL